MVKDAKTSQALKTAEAAKRLRISPSTLTKWRMRGEGPPYIRCGKRLILYDLTSLDEWLASRSSDRDGSQG